MAEHHAAETPEVLVVDDSRTQRRLLRMLLMRRGYRVSEAADGAEALAVLAERPIKLVLSDWMMPRLTGPELCERLRAEEEPDGRVYVILLTARHESEDVARALNAGADDFLMKPIEETELMARLKAGERIVTMQAHLVQKSQEIADAYDKLHTMHSLLERDLALAARVQAEFVPPAEDRCNGARLAALYRAAGHVGGDLLGYFPVGAHGLCAYSVDVCGHGVAAALRSVQVAQLLSPGDPAKSVMVMAGPSGLAMRDPAAAVAELNARCLSDGSDEVYFTMALIAIDLASGIGRFCQAGHSPPALIDRGGCVRFLGAGGPPVGLLPDMSFTSESVRLSPGERIVLYSDGLSEATGPGGDPVSDADFVDALAAGAGLEPRHALEQLVARIGAATGRTCFDDDISALLIEGEAQAASLADRASSSSIEAAKSPASARRASG